jgi:hypothetical protein
MRLFTLGLAAVAVAATGCGDGGESTRTNARHDVTEQARVYFEAFRVGDMDRACAHVAERMLPATRIVGANIGPESDQELPDVEPYSRDGCQQVRERRRSFEPTQRWGVEQVLVDRSATRARVDTEPEGSYWMRRTDGRWLIVAFGSPTPEGVRQFGGDWPEGQFRTP